MQLFIEELSFLILIHCNIATLSPQQIRARHRGRPWFTWLWSFVMGGELIQALCFDGTFMYIWLYSNQLLSCLMTIFLLHALCVAVIIDRWELCVLMYIFAWNAFLLVFSGSGTTVVALQASIPQAWVKSLLLYMHH